MTAHYTFYCNVGHTLVDIQHSDLIHIEDVCFDVW